MSKESFFNLTDTALEIIRYYYQFVPKHGCLDKAVFKSDLVKKNLQTVHCKKTIFGLENIISCYTMHNLKPKIKRNVQIVWVLFFKFAISIPFLVKKKFLLMKSCISICLIFFFHSYP